MDELTLLREFRAGTDDLDEATEDRLRAALRGELAAEARRVRRPRLSRWVRVAVLAGVLGAGMGFGLATWLTPSGSATRGVVGFGFLPAKGWTVVQSGTTGATGTATAVAANVPLRSYDERGLDSLPAPGIALVVRFTTRGDIARDTRFPVKTLPLQLGADGRVRGAVDAYNVDVRAYYGSTPPTLAQVAAAQRQLDRLVVASERVTLFARPAIAPPDGTVTLFGSVDSGKSGETVDIQARDCGQRSFRAVAGTQTEAGGAWSTQYFPGITVTLRAVWDGNASSEITVRQRASVRLRQLPSSPRRFDVGVVARTQFWHRRVTVQRFDRRLGAWVNARSVLLTEQAAAGTFAWTSATFTASFPKGTLLRAFFPMSQARPCYLAAASRLVRVG